MENYKVRLKAGRWLVNEKRFKDLNPNELEVLDRYFREHKLMAESEEKEENSEEIDLLENYCELPENIQEILFDFDEESDNRYTECSRIVALLEQNGYTAEYGLDGELYDLKKL